MSAVLNPAALAKVALLELLDREAAAINMTGLVALLVDHDEPAIKQAAAELYEEGKINRIRIMAPRGSYSGYYSLYVQTNIGYVEREPAPAPVPDPAQLPLPAVESTPIMSFDQVAELLDRAGWTQTQETEVVTVQPDPTAPIQVERRQVDRRALTPLDVIKRWRLPYPLARVVDLIGSQRAQLGRSDAAVAIKMLRDHVRGDE
jgi:hypothetical protein